MTPEQALQNLYAASRRAPLVADEYEAILESVKLLKAFIQDAQSKDGARRDGATEPELK